VLNVGGALQVTGFLKILDRRGRTKVEAGVTTAGLGVVRVGTTPKCQSFAGVRLPDCILAFK
jgi:hypothetical protein